MTEYHDNIDRSDGDDSDNRLDGNERPDRAYNSYGLNKEDKPDPRWGGETEITRFLVCPFCGDGKPRQQPMRRLTAAFGYRRLRQCLCAQGHVWSILSLPRPEDRVPPSPLAPMPVMPAQEMMPRDVSLLTSVVCPYCALGPATGIRIIVTYVLDRLSKWTVAICECDDGHDWGLLLMLDVALMPSDMSVPTRSLGIYADLFDKDGNPREPEFDLDAALREMKLIIEGNDGLAM